MCPDSGDRCRRESFRGSPATAQAKTQTRLNLSINEYARQWLLAGIRNFDCAWVLRIAARRPAGLRYRRSLARLQTRHQSVVARMLGILKDTLKVGRKDRTAVVGELNLCLVDP